MKALPPGEVTGERFRAGGGVYPVVPGGGDISGSVRIKVRGEPGIVPSITPSCP